MKKIIFAISILISLISCEDKEIDNSSYCISEEKDIQQSIKISLSAYNAGIISYEDHKRALDGLNRRLLALEKECN